MKKEIYKLFINPIFKATLFFSFLIVFVITIYNSFFIEPDEKNILEQGIIIVEYDTQEDIARHLELAKIELNNLDSTSLTYEQTKLSLEYRIELYEYLQKHFIPYNQLVDSSVLNSSPSDGFYSFHVKTLSYLMIVVMFVLLILNYVVFSIDFDNLSYKYIYVKGNRVKLIVKKSLLIFINAFLFILFLCVIVSIYGVVLYINNPQYILFFKDGNIKIMNRGLFIFLDSLSIIGFAITMCIFLMGIFIISKKTIYALLIFFVYFICMNSISLITTNKYMLSLFTLPTYSYYDSTLWLNLTFNIGVSLLVYGLGIFKFLKDDL